jgi:hypothetical protein
MELGIDLLVDFFRSGPPLPSHSSVVRGRPLYQPVFVETPLFAAAERKNVHGETDPDGARSSFVGPLKGVASTGNSPLQILHPI